MAYKSTQLKKEIIIEKIITIHYLEYAPDFCSPGELHDFWEVVFVDSGIVEIQADDQKFILQNNMAVFHKPMEYHVVKAAYGKAPSLFIMSFENNTEIMKFFENRIITLTDNDKKIISQILAEAENSFYTPINVHTIEKVELSDTASIGSQQMILNLIEIFLIGIIRRYSEIEPGKLLNENKTSLKYSISNQTSKSHSIDSIIAYLENNIQDNLTVNQIATNNLIGRSQLQNIFNQHFNCGVIHYFNQLKVNRAKQLIRENKFSLQQISDYLGYQSFSYFSRQFKKIVGISPRKYSTTIKSMSEN